MMHLAAGMPSEDIDALQEEWDAAAEEAFESSQKASSPPPSPVLSPAEAAAAVSRSRAESEESMQDVRGKKGLGLLLTRQAPANCIVDLQVRLDLACPFCLWWLTGMPHLEGESATAVGQWLLTEATLREQAMKMVGKYTMWGHYGLGAPAPTLLSNPAPRRRTETLCQRTWQGRRRSHVGATGLEPESRRSSSRRL